jgi:hypothetical protein
MVHAFAASAPTVPNAYEYESAVGNAVGSVRDRADARDGVDGSDNLCCGPLCDPPREREGGLLGKGTAIREAEAAFLGAVTIVSSGTPSGRLGVYSVMTSL